MKSRNSALRTIDVAQRAGYSVQQVRNLERDGVLPAATRTATGYRRYDHRHVQAALAYRSLATGVGPVQAKRIMRAAHRYPDSDLLELLDAAHAELLAERRRLALARQAAEAIAEEPISDPRPSDAMSISELADALGVRTATLRHWDAEGLVVPSRVRGARTYAPSDVRDARIVHQLRIAGYRIPALAELMPQFRAMRRWDTVHRVFADREASIASRSRALLQAAGHLDRLLDPGPEW